MAILLSAGGGRNQAFAGGPQGPLAGILRATSSTPSPTDWNFFGTVCRGGNGISNNIFLAGFVQKTQTNAITGKKILASCRPELPDIGRTNAKVALATPPRGTSRGGGAIANPHAKAWMQHKHPKPGHYYTHKKSKESVCYIFARSGTWRSENIKKNNKTFRSPGNMLRKYLEHLVQKKPKKLTKSMVSEKKMPKRSGFSFCLKSFLKNRKKLMENTAQRNAKKKPQ